jgi:putative FmdB family regulatory protein
MPMYDFQCSNCSSVFEDILPVGTEQNECPQCGGSAFRIFKKTAAILTTIIPSYPGSLKQKAGYVHTHGDRPATKVQSGYGGCQHT